MYDPPDSYVPLIRPAPAAQEPFIMGRLITWDSGTRANTVRVTQEDRVNLPVLESAEASLANNVTVLLIPFGNTHIIAGRIRVP